VHGCGWNACWTQRLEDAFVREVAASPSRLASPQTTFNYAWALAHSADRADVERCIPLAERTWRPLWAAAWRKMPVLIACSAHTRLS